jgi:hypothetical protein
MLPQLLRTLITPLTTELVSKLELFVSKLRNFCEEPAPVRRGAGLKTGV